MELALSLGDSSKPFPSLLNKTRRKLAGNMMDLGFCMGLGSSTCSSNNNEEDIEEEDMMRDPQDEEEEERRASSDPPLQLDLLPSSPVVVPRHHQPPPPPHQMMMKLQWLTPSPSLVSNKPNSCSDGVGRSYEVMSRLLKRKPMAVVEEAEDGGDQSSPNSTSSSFQHLDFSIYRKCFGGSSSKRPWGENHNKDTTRRRIGSSMNVEGDTEATKGGGGSDDEDSGLTRKKLRLSKEQSAFLEESFKEHNTLTPKQKIALAKELNLRPRQVEVWFQNRRARYFFLPLLIHHSFIFSYSTVLVRTKLKQTEVDCEYLKRCCETLTEENRRLQKELQELRALKTSQPFFMQLPATTLTMCPSCERVTSTTTTAASTCKQHPTATTPTTTTTTSPTTTTNSTAGGATLALAPPNNINSSSSSSRLFPFIAAAHAQANVHQARGHPTAS